MAWRVIERTRAGDYRLSLSSDERRFLRSVVAELRSLLDAAPEDEALRRLFPPAYEDDSDAESDYRRMTRDELLAGRRAALRVLEETAEKERLREDEVHAWLRAVNDLRLVLGTRLGVSEELYERDLDQRDPQAQELAVFMYLSWLQEQLVDAVAE